LRPLLACAVPGAPLKPGDSAVRLTLDGSGWIGRLRASSMTEILDSGVENTPHHHSPGSSMRPGGEVDPKGWTEFGRRLDGAAG